MLNLLIDCFFKAKQFWVIFLLLLISILFLALKKEKLDFDHSNLGILNVGEIEITIFLYNKLRTCQ